MAETCAWDDDRFYVENGSVGDNLTAAAFSKRGDIDIRIEEPWAGDTETGFGRVCGFTLNKDEAVKLAKWILARASPSQRPDKAKATG